MAIVNWKQNTIVDDLLPPMPKYVVKLLDVD